MNKRVKNPWGGLHPVKFLGILALTVGIPLGLYFLGESLEKLNGERVEVLGITIRDTGNRPTQSLTGSKYPFGNSCIEMQDAYNRFYEAEYNAGRIRNKITFSLFGESRFREDAFTDAVVCSKGVITISADTYDEVCTNSNMVYVWKTSPEQPLPKYDWGSKWTRNVSEQSCIRT
jgi:hypothetical protein